jgi:hypothetical protein
VNERLAKLLAGCPGVRQAFVVMVPSLTVLVGQGPEEELTPASATAVKRCHATQERVLILDTVLDRQLGHHSGLAFRSVLCLPLPGGKRVLYLDGERPGMFDPQGADQIESHVQSWAEEAPAAPKPRGRPSRAPVNPRIIRALAGLAGVWLLVGLIFRPAGPAPAPVASPTPPPSASQTANEFIALVRLKQFTPARDLLSSRARAHLAPQSFQAAQMAYLEDADRRWDLQYRRAEPQPSEGVVQVIGPKGSEPWSWTFVREEGRWRLDRLEGGPVSVPDGSPPPPSSDPP